MSWLKKLPAAVLLTGTALGSTACDDDPTGPPLSFDTAPVEQVLLRQQNVLLNTSQAHVFLAEHASDLNDLGVTFEPAGHGIEPAGVALAPNLVVPLPVVEAQVEIPAELHGATLVYDPGDGWVVDPDATGAPESGVRVTWYAMDAAGIPILSQRLGHIDLTDQDVDGESRLGVEIVATNTEPDIVVADYVASHAVPTGDDLTERFEASGMLSDGAGQVAFDYATFITPTPFTRTAEVWLDGAGGEYQLIFTTTASQQSSGPVEESWLVSVTANGQLTSLDMEFSGASGQFTASGELLRNGEPVVVLEGAGSSLDYFDAETGDQYVGGSESRLQRLVGIMVETGLRYMSLFALLNL